MTELPPPGPELVLTVRAGFVRQGTSLGRWCRENGYRLQNARNALVGGWDGPKGRTVRAVLIEAAGLARKATT